MTGKDVTVNKGSVRRCYSGMSREEEGEEREE